MIVAHKRQRRRRWLAFLGATVPPLVATACGGGTAPAAGGAQNRGTPAAGQQGGGSQAGAKTPEPLVVVPTPAPATVGFAPSSRTVRAGERFALDLVIDSAAAARGIQFGLQFDAALLQVESVVEAGFFRDWARRHQAQTIALPFTPDNTGGRVGTGAIAILGGPVPTEGPVGKGTVATINLTARPGGSGRTSVSLTDLIVSDGYARSAQASGSEAEVIVAGSGPG